LAARKSGTGAAPPEPEPSAPQPELEAAPVLAEEPPAPLSQTQPEPPPTPPVALSLPLPAPVTVLPAALSREEEEIHRKARRFAKLLVDEIKLYNKSKVDEGRRNKDLYARLEDDIVKSRATYDRRYGHTSAAQGDYFNQELIRNLANNDQSLLGSGFLR